MLRLTKVADHMGLAVVASPVAALSPGLGPVRIAISVSLNIAFNIPVQVTDCRTHDGPVQVTDFGEPYGEADCRTHGGPDTSSRELEHQDGARSLQG